MTARVLSNTLPLLNCLCFPPSPVTKVKGHLLTQRRAEFLRANDMHSCTCTVKSIPGNSTGLMSSAKFPLYSMQHAVCLYSIVCVCVCVCVCVTVCTHRVNTTQVLTTFLVRTPLSYIHTLFRYLTSNYVAYCQYTLGVGSSLTSISPWAIIVVRRSLL